MNIHPAMKKSEDLTERALLQSTAGAVLILFAVKAAYSAHIASEDAVAMLGVLLLTAGIFRAIPALFERKGKAVLALFTMGGPAAAAGLSLLIEPHLTFASYTGLVGIYLLANAVLAIGYVRLRKPSRPGRFLFTAFASLILAAAVVAHWPVVGVWGISLALGASLFVDGSLLIWDGITASSAARAHRDTLEALSPTREKGALS